MNRRAALLLPAFGFLAILFIVPVLGLLGQAVIGRDGALTAAPLLRLWNGAVYLRSLGISLRIALWTAILCVLLAYPVAYVLARARHRGLWMLLVLMPFWSSLLVRIFAWIVLLGRQGPVNAGLGLAGFDAPVQLLGNLGATLTGMVNVLLPFAVLTMLGVMERVDAALPRAAGTLGARPVQAFLEIHLPLSMPGVTAAFLLVFITALGFFIAPALLGSPRETMVTQLVIQQVLELQNWPFASALCLVLLLASLLVFAVFDRLVGLSALTGEVQPPGRGARLLRRALAGVAALLARLPAGRDRAPGPGARWAAGGVIAFLLLPLVFLVPVSLSTSAFVTWPPQGLTLDWYRAVFASPAWAAAALRSLLVGLSCAALCLALVVPACLALMTLGGRTASAVFALLVSPLVVPRLVIATGLFWLYARLGLVGTDLGLVLGHAVIALPYTLLTVAAVLRAHDRRLDQAAASLGARPWQVARHVTLPLIGTGLVAAGLFAFAISFDELNIALFTAGGLAATLPKLMWDEATLRFSPLLAAVSTLVLVLMAALAAAASGLRRSS